MKRVALCVAVAFMTLILSSSSTNLVTSQKTEVVEHYKEFIKECTPKFQSEVGAIMEGTIKSDEYSIKDYTIVTQGLYLLDTDVLKGIIIFMNDSNKEVYLSEVYFDNNYEILAINTEWIGVKLK